MERRKGGTRTKCYVINSDDNDIQSCVFQHNSTDSKIFISESIVPAAIQTNDYWNYMYMYGM